MLTPGVYSMIGIGTIFRHNTGSGGGGISTLMDNWIKEHIVFYYDVKKQGATNETLKESAYLQDLSGRKRNMKLTNFLFAEMSGVGGYNDNFSNWRTDSNNGAVKIESDSSIVIQSVKIEYKGVLYQDSAKKSNFKM